MNYEIVATILSLIIGPIVAILTVSLEYRKNKKEKLLERRDMWLDIHLSDIADQLTYLYYFAEPPPAAEMLQTHLKEFLWERRNIVDVADSFISKHKFETKLVHIKNFQYFLDQSKDPFTITEINKIKNIYAYSLSHIETGYYNIYKDIMDLWDAELEYKKYIESSITVIFDLIKETMSVQFPILKPKLGYGEPSSYNIMEIFYELVRNANGEKVNISLKEENKHGLFFENNASAFVHLFNLDAEKFINEVWVKLKKESCNRLKNLINYNERILDKESIVQKSILGIIDSYVTGYIIEGYCNACKDIKNENDLKKLRPKL